MFEEFSAGYYLGRLYLTPHTGDHAVMDRTQHEEANQQVYATGEPIERLDHPLVVKIDDHHLPVFATDDLPTHTLGLPDPVFEAVGTDDPRTMREVLVAKADYAANLIRWTTPYTVREPDFA